jgi:hypothetical protein
MDLLEAELGSRVYAMAELDELGCGLVDALPNSGLGVHVSPIDPQEPCTMQLRL